MRQVIGRELARNRTRRLPPKPLCRRSVAAESAAGIARWGPTGQSLWKAPNGSVHSIPLRSNVKKPVAQMTNILSCPAGAFRDSADQEPLE